MKYTFALILLLAQFALPTSTLNARVPTSATGISQLMEICTDQFRDDFASTTETPGWTWIDPNSDVQHTLSTLPGYMVLSTASPNNNNLAPGSMNGPRLLRTSPAADHTVYQTRVNITPTHDYQGAGLVAFQDEANFLRLERGRAVTGQSVVFAIMVSNVLTYVSVPTSVTDLELRIDVTTSNTNAYWRPIGGNWQFVGGTDKLTQFSSAGINLIAEFGAPPTQASFDYFQIQVCTSTNVRDLYLPLTRKKGETVITGTLTNRGALLPNTAIELRRYRPGSGTPTELVASATTDANGVYRFAEPPPPAGYVYYVRFRNTGTAANGLLLAFVGDDLAPLVAESTVAVPPIDLADIGLGAPYDPQFIVEINTPIQFNWTPRGIASDSYRFIMEDSQNPTPSFDSGALGNVGLYRLAGRPAGFTTGPTYYVWYIAVDTQAGTGFSFNTGAVEFKN